MKFGKQLKEDYVPGWEDQYLDYDKLKKILKSASKELQQGVYLGDPVSEERAAYISVEKNINKAEAFNKDYTDTLHSELNRIQKFIDSKIQEFRVELAEIQTQIRSGLKNKDMKVRVSAIGNEYSKLEKFVNSNYEAVHKITKKQAKTLPQFSSRTYFVTYVRTQPWAQGHYSDVLVRMSDIYSLLRGDVHKAKAETSAQNFVRQTSKYWVEMKHVTDVKNIIIQKLPVFQYDSDKFGGADAQWVNSVYFDNVHLELYHGRLNKLQGAIAIRIRWYGETFEPSEWVFMERKTHQDSWRGLESVKERFEIHRSKVVEYVRGQYSVEQAVADYEAKRKALKGSALDDYRRLFGEIFQQIDQKRLKPTLRTQYRRSAFQLANDATVRISMDTSLAMFRECPEQLDSLIMSNRWYRDEAYVMRNYEITRFPHAVLEVKLSLSEGQERPDWVHQLLSTQFLNEVHKFSKFIHGCAVLFPTLVTEAPYWIDDHSVRASILASAQASASAISQYQEQARVPRADVQHGGKHPLLGDAHSIQLVHPHPIGLMAIQESSQSPADEQRDWFQRLVGLFNKPRQRDPRMQKLEPKSFLANERTFLTWLHMAVVIGSIASALVGYAAQATSRQLSLTLELYAIILLPVALLIAYYAVTVFLLRGQRIARREQISIDDPRGPVVLSLIIILALCAIFAVEVYDLVITIREGAGDALLAMRLQSEAAREAVQQAATQVADAKWES